jgi:hypothetical protein
MIIEIKLLPKKLKVLIVMKKIILPTLVLILIILIAIVGIIFSQKSSVEKAHRILNYPILYLEQDVDNFKAKIDVTERTYYHVQLVEYLGEMRALSVYGTETYDEIKHVINMLSYSDEIKDSTFNDYQYNR